MPCVGDSSVPASLVEAKLRLQISLSSVLFLDVAFLLSLQPFGHDNRWHCERHRVQETKSCGALSSLVIWDKTVFSMSYAV